MKPKHKRLTIAIAAVVSISVGVLLILSALRDNVVFFYSPSEIMTKQIDTTQRVRIGGLVVDGSVEKAGSLLRFKLADGAETVAVSYQGVAPGLFREGQGVVAEGKMVDGIFMAETLLAKHDENYMPPEVAEAIKKSGHWKEKVKTEGFPQ